MTELIREIREGFEYVYMGQVFFFRDRSLWKYALIPLLFVAGIYCAVIVASILWLYPGMVALFDRLASTCFPILSSMESIVGVITAALVFFLIWTTVGVMYQCFAAFTFDALVEAFEEKYFHYSGNGVNNTPDMIVDGILLSSRNAVFYMGLLLLSMVVPAAGHVVCIILLGYLTGISNLQASAANHGFKRKKILYDSSQNYIPVTISGVLMVLLESLPLVSFVFAPGFVIAGTLIYNDKVLSNRLTISTNP